MKQLILILSLVGPLAIAAPECLIDARSSGRLVDVVSGAAKGFLPNEPVFVTVTNAGKDYTTQVSRTGTWAVVFADAEPNTNVLCWQGSRLEAKASRE